MCHLSVVSFDVGRVMDRRHQRSSVSRSVGRLSHQRAATSTTPAHAGARRGGGCSWPARKSVCGPTLIIITLKHYWPLALHVDYQALATCACELRHTLRHVQRHNRAWFRRPRGSHQSVCIGASKTRSSAMAEGPRNALVSTNSATKISLS